MQSTPEDREIQERAERRRKEMMEALSNGVLAAINLPSHEKARILKEPVMTWNEMRLRSLEGKENQLPSSFPSTLLYPSRPPRSVYNSPLLEAKRSPLWKSPVPSPELPPYQSRHLSEKGEERTWWTPKLQKSLCESSVNSTPYFTPPATDNIGTSPSSFTPASVKVKLYPSLSRMNMAKTLEEEKERKDWNNRTTANNAKNVPHNNFPSSQMPDSVGQKYTGASQKECEDDIQDSHEMDMFLEEALGSELNSTITNKNELNHSEDSFHSLESCKCDTSLKSSMPSSSFWEDDDKVNILLKEAEKQQQLMAQASKAITLCRASKEFLNSASLVDAERLLLIASLRHQSALNEIRDGKPSSNPDELKGHLRFLEICATLKSSFYRSKTDQKNDIWFLGVVCCGQQILATDVIEYETGARYISFSNPIELSNLSSTFVATLQIFTFRNGRKTKESVRRSKISRVCRLLRRQSKSCIESLLSSEHLLHLRTPAFVFSGSLSIDLPSVAGSKERSFKLDKVPIMSPLGGTVCIRTEISVTCNHQHSGFLTVLEKAGGSHSWQHRWCVLKDLQLYFWNYPTDQDEKVPIETIDLRSCCSERVEPAPRHLCSRPRTLMLQASRSCAPNDLDSTLMECKSDHTTIRHFLSCDSMKELNEWASVLNDILTSMKAWHNGLKDSPLVK